MARGRIQLKRIENPVHRQVTFCKRRAGLLKKAKELSVLCDAEIGLVIFSAHGKLYELATKGTMQGVIERYMKFTGAAQPEEPPTEPHHHPLDAKEEADVLKQEIDTLQKGISYLFGGGTGTMTIDDLQILEKNLETWIYQIRSMKMNLMLQEIQDLRDKEGTLKAANKFLHDKILENTTAFTNFAPFATDSTYPLTIQDGIFPALGNVLG
ncbi:agamous-like MADS-box protein AGL12 [Arachis duranensis]|uniref:Agamous-like MADS-box protein AGL12 n=1 Tax=Arachis duranensis TaxID=130453 RepID=A0A6P4CKK4_ARADU|nr:agamous-like MADS-box protein AGL12 [Arachis duranensis]XP_057751874.1 agamous-like MADS-box protein AGL12 [Arachis stenosperma]